MCCWIQTQRMTGLGPYFVFKRDADGQKLPASQGHSGLYKALPLPKEEEEGEKSQRDWRTNIFVGF